MLVHALLICFPFTFARQVCTKGFLSRASQHACHQTKFSHYSRVERRTYQNALRYGEHREVFMSADQRVSVRELSSRMTTVFGQVDFCQSA